MVAQMLMPGVAPVKIDLWRRVRHPPPDFVHAFCLKPAAEDVGDALVTAGHPMKLVGKMISFAFDCKGLEPGPEWRVLIDVLQDDASVPGYPFVHFGPMPGNHPLAMLKITELVVDT